MEKTNTRNSYGVKCATNTYRTINGESYTHWTDFATKEECQADEPKSTFIKRGDSIFKKVTK